MNRSTRDEALDTFIDADLDAWIASHEGRTALDAELARVLPQHLIPAAFARCVPSDVADPSVALAVLRSVRVVA